MLTVALGSKNPVKLKATSQAFKILSKEIKVIGVEVKDLVSQPIGIEQTIVGAVKRACIAVKMIREASYGVGIEGGLIECPNISSGYLNGQVVAIVNREFRLSLGLGPGFELPSKIVNEILLSKKELDKVAEEFVGEKDIGSKYGIIMSLTRGNLSRFDITRIAVTMALVPWLNPKHYKLSKVPSELL
jgi:inosine/xanthosine triphosphatase